MPPPRYLHSDVELHAPISLYPTLAALCARQPEADAEPGRFTVGDVGRECDYAHGENDGYFYRLFQQGRHVGWQWQDVLGFLMLPEDERDEDYLDSLEIPVIDFEGKWAIGGSFSTPVPVLGWKRLNKVGKIGVESAFSPERLIDAGTLGCEGALIDIEKPFICERVSVYLLRGADGNEFWSIEELMEAALGGEGPKEVIERIE